MMGTNVPLELHESQCTERPSPILQTSQPQFQPQSQRELQISTLPTHMSLTSSPPPKFDSPARTTLIPRPSTSRFPPIAFDRPGKSNQGIRLTAPSHTPISSPNDVVPNPTAKYPHPKMVLKIAVSCNFFSERVKVWGCIRRADGEVC